MEKCFTKEVDEKLPCSVSVVVAEKRKDFKFMLPFVVCCCKLNNTCHRTVTCKVLYWINPTSLNQPQHKLGQSCANSWCKSGRLANSWQACLVLLCAGLTPFKQVIRKLPGQSIPSALRVKFTFYRRWLLVNICKYFIHCTNVHPWRYACPLFRRVVFIQTS